MPFGIDDALERLQPVADPSPRWTDEMSFSAWDATTELLVLVRATVLQNLGEVRAAVQLWVGPELERELHATGPLLPTDWDVMAIGDAVTVRLVAAGQTWAVQLSGDDLIAHLEWDGQGPAVRYDAHPEGPLPASIARGHYEQPARVRGDVVLRGQRIAVDGLGQREHSWGFPQWTRLHQWHWVAGALDDGRTFSLLDAFHDDSTSTVHGYVSGSGAPRFVVGAEREVQLDGERTVGTASLVLHLDDGESVALRGRRDGPMVVRRPHDDATVVVHDLPMRFSAGDVSGRGVYERLVTEFD